MNASSSSSESNCVACPDTTCSTRPTKRPCSMSVAARNCTTNARWGDSGDRSAACGFMRRSITVGTAGSPTISLSFPFNFSSTVIGKGPMTPTSPLLFPPFRLDLVNECVWRERQQIPLRGKTFAVLRCLVEHAGQLVSKEALLNAVWPQNYVSDVVLMVCIGELRKVLGDDAKQPQYIETVHRRGYRFIGAVTEQMNEPVVYFERTEDPPGP